MPVVDIASAGTKRKSDKHLTAQRAARERRLDELAPQINECHARVVVAGTEALTSAIAAGELLNEAKDRVPHGGWAQWLREHCQPSERVASGYMRLAREQAAIQAKVTQIESSDSDLSIRGALRLLAPSRSKSSSKTKAKTGTENKVENADETSALPTDSRSKFTVINGTKPKDEVLAHVEGIGAPALIDSRSASNPAAEHSVASGHEQRVADLRHVLRAAVALGLSRDIWTAIEQTGQRSDPELHDLIRGARQLLVGLAEYISDGSGGQ